MTDLPLANAPSAPATGTTRTPGAVGTAPPAGTGAGQGPRIGGAVPLVVDTAFYAGVIRRGLLAYRIVSILLSAVIVAVVSLGVVVLRATAQTSPAGLPARPIGLIDVVMPAVMLALLLALAFAAFRFAVARIFIFAVLAAPGFYCVVLGGIKLMGLAYGLARGAWAFDTAGQVVLIQGAALTLNGSLLMGIAGGVLASLRLDRQTCARVWQLGRAPLQILNVPRWFFRLGGRSWLVVPLYTLVNAVFCCAVAAMFIALYRMPFALNRELGEALAGADGTDNSIAYAMGEASGGAFVLLLLAAGAAWLLRQGRRMGTVQATTLRRRDQRPPVVFLRSFADDTVRLGRMRLSGFVRTLSFEVYPETLDALLAHEALRIGPPVALGNPADRRAVAGVPRDWVEDGEDWRARILADLDAAQKIIVVVDETEGTRWEVDRILATPALLGRTVFLKPPHRALAGLPVHPLPEGAASGALAALWARPEVTGVEMSKAGPSRLFVSGKPDALDYQILLREVLQPSPRLRSAAPRAADGTAMIGHDT